MFAQTLISRANPTGGQVVSGTANINTTPGTVTINQATSTAIINWQAFSIASGELTRFQVPTNASATLNRVTGGNVSTIYGTLQSNGLLYLINPNGIVIGASGQVNTAGFIASTLNFSDAQFNAQGNLNFSGSSTASVINQGTIHASTGDVYLIATQVANSGTITAPQGNVGLAAGSQVLLQQAGDQHLFVQAGSSVTSQAAGVTNTGAICSATAELKAAGGNAYALAINNSGNIAATGVTTVNGQVYLTADGGNITNSGKISAQNANGNGGTIVVDGSGTSSTGNTVLNSGTLDASATVAGGSGGSVTLKNMGGTTIHRGQILAKGGQGGVGGNAEISGVLLHFSGTVDLRAPDGTTGNLLLDPATLDVITGGGSILTASTVDPTTVDAALGTANLTLNANTNITVTNGITWTSANTLTLSTNTAGSTIDLLAPISGVNGGLTIDTAAATDQITTGASGSVAVANFILQNGTWNQNSATLPAFSATINFELEGSSTFERFTGGSGTTGAPLQITDVYGLQGLASPSNSLLTDSAELMNNINAAGTSTWNSGAGFVPIGNGPTNYNGNFNGQGHTIDGLYINRPAATDVALIGATGGLIENVGLTNVQITGNIQVCAIVGDSGGTVLACYSTGAVSGSGGDVGGLVGYEEPGATISNSYSTVAVTAGSSSQYVGGLVGANVGTINNSYSVGAVSAGAASLDVGGLVGNNYAGGTISKAYCSGLVTGGTGSTNVGGLVGLNSSTISASFWDTTTSGQATGVGVGTATGATGDPTATLMTASTYSGAGWSIGTSTNPATNTWVILTGQTRPMLAMEYSTTITNAHQLQLIDLNSTTLAASYTVANNIDLTGTTNASDVWGTSTTNGGAGFVPIGNGTTAYTGTFNGQNFTINGLYINAPSASYVGLFGNAGSGATIEGVGVTNVQVSGSVNVGGLVGYNNGAVETSYTTGPVRGADYVGGLVGQNNVSGTVETSHATGAVTGADSYVGGLVGENYEGTVETSYATGTVNGSGNYVGGLVGQNNIGTVENSYAIGTVSGAGSVGGLVGWNDAGFVGTSYATGAVSGSNVGGLVGSNSAGTVQTSYSTGAVSGSGSVGGLVGQIAGGTVQTSYWAQDTGLNVGLFGIGSVSSNTGAAPETIAAMEQSSTFTPAGTGATQWDFTTPVWIAYNGTNTPQLAGLPTTTPPIVGSSLGLLSGTDYSDSGGTIDALTGTTIDLIYNGSLLGSTTTNSSGGFSFSVSATDLTGGILLTDPTNNGNTYYQANSPLATITGVDLWGSTLRVLANAASNTALGTTAGGQTVNYAVAGANLSTHSGINMAILSNYTLDGNVTASGTLSTSAGSSLAGSAAATLTGSTVNLSGTFSLTGALTVNSTSGEILLDNVGTSASPATAPGVTLNSNSSGAVIVNASYLTLGAGGFSATGTGFASTTQSTNIGEPDGVDVYGSTINVQGGGSINLNGTAGYFQNTAFGSTPLSAGTGVNVGDSTLETSGAGNIMITGNGPSTAVTSVTGFSGVEISNQLLDGGQGGGSTVSVATGTITITGNVLQGTAGGNAGTGAGTEGVFIGGYTGTGSELVEATGTGGSVSITGSAQGSTVLAVSSGGDGYSAGVEIGGGNSGTTVSVSTGGSITIHGTGGTIDASNAIDTVNEDPYTQGVSIDSGATISADAGGASAITITGTGGAITTTTASTGGSSGVSIDSSTISMALGGTLGITGTGGAVNAGMLNGANAGDANSDGVELGTYNNTGNATVSVKVSGSISITGTGGAMNTSNTAPVTGNNNPSASGVNVDSGSDLSATGTTTITLMGTGGNVTNGSTLNGQSIGVDVGNDGSDPVLDTIVSSGSGAIQITGHAGNTPNLGIGAVVNGFKKASGDGDGMGTVESTTGNISITGTGGTGYTGTGVVVGNYVPNYGVVLVDNATVQTGGAISLTGTGGSNSLGVGIEEITGDPTIDTNPVLPTVGAGGAFSATALSGTGIYLNGNVTAASATLGSGTAGNPSSVTSGELEIQSSDITLSGGNLTAFGSGYVNASNANGDPNGIHLISTTINAQGGIINLTGNAGYDNPGSGLTGGFGVHLDGNDVLETTGSGNITITGAFAQNIISTSVIEGVAIDGTGNSLQAGAGTISITGTASQGTSGNSTTAGYVAGILVTDGSTIQTGNSGSISLTGNASGSTSVDFDNNGGGAVGIELNGNGLGTNLVTVGTGGSITLGGTGGKIDTSNDTSQGGAGDSSGVRLSGGDQVTAGDNSTITITGQGGSAVSSGAYGGSAAGVKIGGNSGNTAAVTISVGTDALSTTGGISITGTGGTTNTTNTAATSNNHLPGVQGVNVNSSSTISTTGTSTITINGTGGTVTSGVNKVGEGVGVVIGSTSSTPLPTLVSSSSGNIAITGVAGTSPNLDVGVLWAGFGGESATVSSSTGLITITGTGGSASTGSATVVGFQVPSYGVAVVDDTLLETTSGPITLSGSSGATGVSGVAILELPSGSFDSAPTLPTITVGGTLTATATSGTGIFLNAQVTTSNATLTGNTLALGGSLTSPGTAIFNSTGAITDAGSLQVGTFILQNGTWNQIVGQNGLAALPAFSATTNFALEGTSTFERFDGGAGTSGSPYEIADIYGLQGLASPSGNLLSADAELVNSFNATGTATWNSGTGFVPIGNRTSTFVGTFNGQGFTINNLYINSPSTSHVGLFGEIGSGSLIENVGATNVQVTGSSYVGGLVGDSNGTISNAYSTGTVSGVSDVGGLVGYNSATVEMSYATGAVTVGGGSSDVGGLVGTNDSGTISSAYSAAAITAGGGSVSIGGLVGLNENGATISNTFSTGAVTAGSASSNIGGLVGYSDPSTISNSYTTGTVIGGGGSTDVGALVGLNAGTISNSFWDMDTAGSGVVSGAGSDATPNTTPGVTGATTTQLESQTYILANAPTLPTWNFATVWTTYGGTETPQLIGLSAIPVQGTGSGSGPGMGIGTNPGDPSNPVTPVSNPITQIGPISQAGQSPVQGYTGNTLTQNTDVVGGASGVASPQDQTPEQDLRRKLANRSGRAKADDLIKVIREDIKDGSTVNTGTEESKWASNTGLSKIVHIGEYAQIFQGLALSEVGNPLIFKLFQQQASASVRNELSQAARGTNGNGH